MKRVGLLSLVALAVLGYAFYPMIVILLAPLCSVVDSMRPGRMIITERNTVICPSLAGISQLSRTKALIIDLPPWMLVKNGCFPAANILVKVIDVQGDFAEVLLPKAADKTRMWWVVKNPSGQDHHG